MNRLRPVSVADIEAIVGVPRGSLGTRESHTYDMDAMLKLRASPVGRLIMKETTANNEDGKESA